jgi:hypothetical protein
MPIRDSISVWIEQDILVPDTKPDAMKIINVTVNPYVTDIEVMDNKVKVTGKLNYYVIYRTNETNMGTRGLFVSLPYTQVLNVKGIKRDTDVRVKPIVKNVIYSLPNERKIAIKTEIIFKVIGVESTSINLIQRFSPDYKVEVKLNETTFNNLLNNKYNVIASKEDVMIPNENADFYEILKIDPSIINTEYKESYNKIMVKGDILVNLLYLADKQDTEIKKLSLEIPFSGMIELDNITDKSQFSIDFVINDFNIKPNTEMSTTKTMSVDYQIGVYVNMFEQESIAYVDDFYSEEKELKCERSLKRAIRDENVIVKNIDVKETLNNILPDNSKLIDYTIDTSYIVLKQIGSNVNVEGNIKIGALVQNLDTLEIENKSVDVLVNEEFTLEDIKPDTNISLDIVADKVNISQNGNDMDVRIKLNLDIKSEDMVDLNIVDKIEENDLDLTNLDSMNIYIVKPKDTLWAIAKKYNTTVDKIIKTNDLTDQTIINVGQKILIIR